LAERTLDGESAFCWPLASIASMRSSGCWRSKELPLTRVRLMAGRSGLIFL
jgi:hypothetical protein